MEWIKTTLKEISTDVSYGYTASAQADECGPKFLRITDIVPYFVDYNSVPYCKIDKNKCKQYLLENGDLIIARTGATTGYNYLFEDDIPTVFASYLIRFRLSKTKVVPKLIKYIVKTDNYFSFINNHISGAAQPGINAPTLGNYSFLIPKELKYQRKIAKILSNYDDLIKNNNKRIKILEEMAQKIYKEWFVDFKFPNHETATFKQTELGKIPTDWNFGTIKDINDVKGGYAFKSNDLKETGEYGVIKIKNIQSGDIDINSCQYINERIAQKAEAFKLSVGDLLIAMTGAQVGKVGMMPKTKRIYYLNQRVGKFIPNKDFIINNQYLSIYTRSEKFNTQINNVASGAAQPNISTFQIENIEMLIPQKEIIKKFEKMVNPLFIEILTLNDKNTNLKQTRDLLLPRLISGEINVENLEIL